MIILAILAITGKVSCQTFADTISTLTSQGKGAEQKIITLALSNGEQATISGNSAVIWENDTITVKVTFTDDSRKTPTTFLMVKGKRIYYDNDVDGAIDVMFVNNGPFKDDHEKMIAQLTTRLGEVSQTEIDMSDIMQRNLEKTPFVMYNFRSETFYSTSPNSKGIMPFPEDSKKEVQKGIQGRFLNALK